MCLGWANQLLSSLLPWFSSDLKLPKSMEQNKCKKSRRSPEVPHLSPFEVIKDILCILRTQVTVFRVLRVDVKLFWDLRKLKRRGVKMKGLLSNDLRNVPRFLQAASGGGLVLPEQQGTKHLQAPLLRPNRPSAAPPPSPFSHPPLRWFSRSRPVFPQSSQMMTCIR